MTKRPAKARILLIEDDPAILHGLLDVLVFHGYEATGVEDGAEGCKIALTENFDAMIVDIMLPSLDGLSICQKIRAQKPAQGIILLTAKGSEEDIVKGFKAGADDYVSKPFSLREFMVRLEAILRRAGKNTGDEEIRVHDLVFSGKTLTASSGEQSLELTRREMDILLYLYRHHDRIVSKKELLSEVWNYPDPEIETRTVDIHILKLRKKIETLSGGIALIQTVRGEGYRLEMEQ
ncbi:two component transcriptional regulator, winged helix family [Candidatus Vecturithrix granuli]|uniref:Two component transcriptional regulator, winged helix family n=1 Tax=Vecturithrix granuli TaxID=1499967 RepID=A0A081C313_VECG1|nr:two component transcriptional regulator, winged helix family [Candidatus Vecturithrix granuli]